MRLMLQTQATEYKWTDMESKASNDYAGESPKSCSQCHKQKVLSIKATNLTPIKSKENLGRVGKNKVKDFMFS